MRYAMGALVEEYEKQGIRWNGKLVLIGDSMGGEVMSVVSEKLFPDGVILTEPAAYSVYAHHVKFGKRHNEEPVFGGDDGVIRSRKPDDSFALESIGKYMGKTPKGKVLVVEFASDRIVGKIPQDYKASAEVVDSIRTSHLLTKGEHGATPAEEVETIKNFVKSL